MAQQLEPLESLLASASGREAGKWKSITFAAIAVYLLCTAAWQFWSGDFGQKAWLNLLLGCCSVLVVKYEKRIYVSPLGFVKETHTWHTHHREILPWDEVRCITLRAKNGRLMLLAERDVTGWKLFFKTEDQAKIKEIFKRYAPKVKVNEIYQRF